MAIIKSVYKTRQQELLFAYLEKMKGKHFTAEDVRSHFEQAKTPIGIATVYRHLEKLAADGVVQKYFIDEHSAACFEYSGKDVCSRDNEHFHLKCDVCGALIHLECGELADISRHLLSEHGFALNPFRTVLYGTCGKCAKKAAKKNK